MLETMFQGVWYANTQTQIHKYGLYTNIVNDEMSVNPMKCYVFGKPLMQGCRIWYLELLTMQIQNTNTQIQCIWKYPNLQLYVLQMGAWPYPPWLVSCNKRSVLIPERTTLQSNSIQTYKHVPIVNFSPMLIMMTIIKIPSLSLAMIMTIMTMIKILMYWWPSSGWHFYKCV